MKTGSRLQCSNRSSGRKKEAGKTIENRTQPELVPNQASKSNIVRGALKISSDPIGKDGDATLNQFSPAGEIVSYTAQASELWITNGRSLTSAVEILEDAFQ